MNNKRGKLIVLEGVDGTGKHTQTELLLKRLLAEKLTAATWSFPQYEKETGKRIKEYLGTHPDNVNPYEASLLYAEDRFEAKDTLEALLLAGDTVVLDRYVDSNVGHQGGKIEDEQKRKDYLEWLYDLEYGGNGIPRPDLVVILRLSPEVAQERAKKRGGPSDGHEANLAHLMRAEKAYVWLTEKYPHDHAIVDCAENGEQLSPELIHDKVWKKVSKLLSR